MTIAATTPSTAAPGSSVAAPSGALGKLSSNFSDFLNLLMTQLKNQDPTSPMDANEFTSELVQFSSVEQQINTNTSLTRLIELTQAGEVMQSTAMVGKQVEVQATDLVLQAGNATIAFTAPAAQPALISIATDAGTKLMDTVTPATKGSNTWSWDGKDAKGRAMPDGTYKVTVSGANVDGTTTALSYTVVGTATGVASDGTSLNLQLGKLSVPFSAVRSVRN
ncbi:MAG: flagellar biosynthesis protein FlgD [Rhodospirillales bacterium]|nr:flagellar biosynthesis protein FlgD [Rhodospirillales bacterium]MBN8905597.1 flagellar biosynthesis protein FlgD [Rhodospirillales bacterium]